jgi:methionine synthase II (cobalamin-independent)
MLGIVPSTAPERTPSAEQLADKAAALADRLGFPRSVLAERFGITPSCGLAGAKREWARTAIELAQAVDELTTRVS